MRKEPLIAIIVGSLLGVAVAFGIWQVSRNQSETQDLENAEQNIQISSEANNVEFKINNPKDLAVVDSSELEVSGTAPIGSLVVIKADEYYFASSDNNGSFSIPVSLASGLNSLAIWSLAPGQMTQESYLTIVYTTRLTRDASESSSLLGTVTDIASETIQIRTQSGSIEQVSINEQTSYASLVSNSGTIEFSDIAIGDFVTALGPIGEASVMAADRILVTSEPEAPAIAAAQGDIQDVTTRNLSIIDTKTGEELSVDFSDASVSRFVDGALEDDNLTSSEPGDQIVVIGELSDGQIVAEQIILL